MNEISSKSFLVWCGSLLMLGFCLAPVAYMVLISVSENAHFIATNQAFQFTLQHYQTILTSRSLHFPDYLRNSLIVSGISALLSICLASPAAYAVTRLRLPGRALMLLLVLAASMFPPISLVAYLFRLMSVLGWVNTYGALILPYLAWTLPLSLWILVSYFLQIPQELDHAALVDGCSRWQAFRLVILPVAAPGIFSTLLLAFIFAFNEFMFALMLTTDYRARTVPVGIALLQGLHGETPWGDVMAASTVSILPLIGLTLIFQRRIIQGLTRGALKG